MKFSLEEQVKLVSGRIGTIKQYQIEGHLINGQIVESVKYYVHFNKYTGYWYEEKELLRVGYEFSNKFEQSLAKLMIDINLDSRNYDMVNNFNTIKQSYLR